MNAEEEKLSDTALGWVKSNRRKIIDLFTEGVGEVVDSQPVTLFLAGSPGAGKTEFSTRLIEKFTQKPMRIDADEIRTKCPGYTGENAHLLQRAATKGVHILYDYALKKNLNVVMDGTFAYENAESNIQRSLDHNRQVEIYFVYQDPVKAWDVTKKREEIEQRRVSKEVFIDTFFKSRKNVNLVKEKFGNELELNLLIKDFERDFEQLELNISNVDNFLKRVYTKEELTKLLI